MASLSANLKTLMSFAKINASELARRTGVAQPIIHRISTGQNLNPKLATIRPIARYFTVKISQLIGEEPLPNDRAFLQTSLEHRGWNRVPLISWKDAIAWPKILPDYQKKNNTVYVSTDANVTKMAYGLTIQGSAMEPMLPKGTTIIIEPSRTAGDRDYVLVYIHSRREPALKQVIMDGDNKYLKSLNPDLENMKILTVANKDLFLGVMAQAKVDY